MSRGSLNTSHAAAYLDVKPCTVRDWAKKGYLAHVRVGRCLLFRMEILERFLKEREVQAYKKVRP